LRLPGKRFIFPAMHDMTLTFPLFLCFSGLLLARPLLRLAR
jgi:hypothetical protein